MTDKVVAVEGAQSEVIHVLNTSTAPQIISIPSISSTSSSSLGASSGLQTFTITTPVGNLSIPVTMSSMRPGSTPILPAVTGAGGAQLLVTNPLTAELKKMLYTAGDHPGSIIDVATKLKELQAEPGRRPQILIDRYEICIVCGDRASGRHYGVVSCEGCKGFFKRSIRKKLGYSCRGTRECPINKHYRNRCQFCRLQKCFSSGMQTAAVQQERKPPSPEKTVPQHIATSANRIYIRKDLSSTGPATRTFTDQEGLLTDLQERLVHTDRGTVILGSSVTSNNTQNTDLSTLASVVTTLATMNKDQDCYSGGGGDSAARAFDAMAKAATPRLNQEPTDESLNQSDLSTDGDEIYFEVEGHFLEEHNFNFELMPLSPMPAYLNVHYICESASRLLFLSMHWARVIKGFTMLEEEVQTHLVRRCWSELFALGLSQCSQSMHLNTILTAIMNHLRHSVEQDKISSSRVETVTETIDALKNFSDILLPMDVDATEYAYLKTIILFSPENAPVRRRKQIEWFQNRALEELRVYDEEHYSENPQRVMQLLVKLPALRALSPAIMEELFFAGLIGNVQIDSIIPYILRMETNEFNAQMGLPANTSAEGQHDPCANSDTHLVQDEGELVQHDNHFIQTSQNTNQHVLNVASLTTSSNSTIHNLSTDSSHTVVSNTQTVGYPSLLTIKREVVDAMEANSVHGIVTQR